MMDSFRYETGASKVRLIGLANANFASMSFQSGAGNYYLDFSGDLQQDATVRIRSGLSNVDIVVPEGTSARVSITGGLSNVLVHGTWRQEGDDYVQEGQGPTLTIRVEMGAGNLILSNQ